METRIERLRFYLAHMGLNEYQASALAHLIYLGEVKATTLSKASGVPDARIYGVLEELSQKGLVITRPGRPALYSPMTPPEISDALIAEARDEIKKRLSTIETYRTDFTEEADEIFRKGGGLGERVPLIRIVSLGDASTEETKKLYTSAQETLLIMTRAMEYLPEVKDELEQAGSRGTNVRVLMRSRESLDPLNADTRDEMIITLKQTLGDNVEIRVSGVVPIRGCITDPEKGGRALFLVEEEGVPYAFREAAITSHPGVVRGLTSLFELKWKYDSEEPDITNSP